MATKPASLPVRATDATFSSGPESGNPTKIEPSAGYKTQGFVPGGNFASEYENWWGNLVYQWAAYLDDLHNSTDFLNKNYTWTGTHEFAEPVGLSSGSTVTTFDVGTQLTASSAIIVNLDADDINATNNIDADGTINCDGGFTTNTASGFNVAGATTGNFNFTGTKPSREVHLKILGGDASIGWENSAAASTYGKFLWDSSPDTDHIYYAEVDLPDGAVLQSFRVAWRQEVSATTNMTAELVYCDTTTAAVGADTLVSGVTFSTLFGNDLVAVNAGIAHTIVNTNRRYYLKFTASDPVGDECYVYWVKAGFDDPGPRNY